MITKHGGSVHKMKIVHMNVIIRVKFKEEDCAKNKAKVISCWRR